MRTATITMRPGHGDGFTDAVIIGADNASSQGLNLHISHARGRCTVDTAKIASIIWAGDTASDQS
jgi:hypothetical protein